MARLSTFKFMSPFDKRKKAYLELNVEFSQLFDHIQCHCPFLFRIKTNGFCMMPLRKMKMSTGGSLTLSNRFKLQLHVNKHLLYSNIK